MLLLEIGFWRSALKLNEKGFKNTKKAEDAQAILIDSAGKDLAHIMGSKYSQAVLACLTGRWKEKDDRELDFRVDVVNILGELAA